MNLIFSRVQDNYMLWKTFYRRSSSVWVAEWSNTTVCEEKVCWFDWIYIFFLFLNFAAAFPFSQISKFPTNEIKIIKLNKLNCYAKLFNWIKQYSNKDNFLTLLGIYTCTSYLSYHGEYF